MVDLNIKEDQVHLKELTALFEASANVEDVFLLVHQAGCPVYIIRDTEGLVALLWHPYIDESKNTLTPKVVDGTLLCVDEYGMKYGFFNIEDVKGSALTARLLNGEPFSEWRLVWRRN